MNTVDTQMIEWLTEVQQWASEYRNENQENTTLFENLDAIQYWAGKSIEAATIPAREKEER